MIYDPIEDTIVRMSSPALINGIPLQLVGSLATSNFLRMAETKKLRPAGAGRKLNRRNIYDKVSLECIVYTTRCFAASDN